MNGKAAEITISDIAFAGMNAKSDFKMLFLCMSLSQNRCALLGDVH
jgi:hypothetical protein